MGIIQKKVIRTSCLLLPDEITSEWKKNLMDKINKTMAGRCTYEHGYIIKIMSIHRIIDQQITRIDGNLRFYLDVRLVALRPEISKVIDATVEMIFPNGIFCHYRMMRMMLPFSMCPGFSIRHEFSMICATNPSTVQTIRKNDIIRVRIEDIRFENNLYSCIVSLLPTPSKEIDVKQINERGGTGKVILHEGVQGAPRAVPG